MVISYFGLGFVKIQAGELVIVFNPTSKLPNRKTAKFGSNIVLVSLNDSLYNEVGLAARDQEEPFVISGPGEYEVSGVFVRGFPSGGAGKRINTIYLLTLDGVRLVHLGALTGADLPAEIKEELGAIDILFVPVGGPPAGGGVLEAKPAAQLASDLEPKLIIPINYADDKALQSFLKEAGNAVKEPVETLTIKKKDLAEKTGEVLVVRS